jgi:SAM-dependent methyltransferase
MNLISSILLRAKIFSEQIVVENFIAQYSHGKNSEQISVLDVGCGNGRYLEMAKKRGWQITGIEKNEKIVAANKQRGFSCFTPEQLHSVSGKFDVVLMSHIVEHFSPHDLLKILETYVGYLKPQGILVVATPLYTANFYDDFDHVRPYQPLGFQILLTDPNSQLQFQWPVPMKMEDLWFRSSPLRFVFCKARYFKTACRPFMRLSDLFFNFLFRISFGLIGQKTGWVGVFRKL